MDPQRMSIPIDPARPADPPASRGMEPGKRKRDAAEVGEAKRSRPNDEKNGAGEAAASAELTASFAEILRSKDAVLRKTANPVSKGIGEPAAPEAASKGKGGAKQALQKSPSAAIEGLAAGKRPGPGADGKAATVHAVHEESGGRGEARPLSGPTPEKTNASHVPAGAVDAAGKPEKKFFRMAGGPVSEPMQRPEGADTVASMAKQEGEVLKNLSPARPGQEETSPAGGRKAPRTSKSAAQRHAGNPSAESMPGESAERLPSGTGSPAEAGAEPPAGTEGAKRQPLRAAVPGIEAPPIAVHAEPAAPLPDRASPAGPAVRPQAVVAQVVEGTVQILREGPGRMVLALQPPRLGTLDLDVSVQGNRIEMTLLADNREVKQMLQANMDDLRNALADKGFQIDRLDVLVQDRPDGSGPGFWERSGFGSDNGPRRETPRPQAAPDPAGPRPGTGEGGLSVFA